MKIKLCVENDYISKYLHYFKHFKYIRLFFIELNKKKIKFDFGQKLNLCSNSQLFYKNTFLVIFNFDFSNVQTKLQFSIQNHP